MERGRKTKIITIIALVVAIVTMSLGFAVFSNVLTISSSATVKPNAEDYVVNIYGLSEEIPENFGGELSEALSYMTSKTTSFPYAVGNVFDAAPAIIDNRNFTISNLNAIFTDDEQEVWYYFLIKNEGEKSVYIDFANTIVTDNKTCIAGENTSQELADQDCDKIHIEAFIITSANKIVQNVISYEIVPNDYTFGVIYINVAPGSEFVSDGEFTVTFDDIQLAFSSVDNSQNS